MTQTFSILVKQREAKPSNRMNLVSTSLSASSSSTFLSASSCNSRNGNFKKNYSHNKNGNNTHRGSSTHFQNANKNTYPIPDVNKANFFCDYCKKFGHTENKCYRLHDFPQNFKFTRGRNSGSAANAHTKCEVPLDNIAGNHSHNPSHGTQSLTKDQYDHLVRLLENVQVQGTSGSTKDTLDNIMSGAVNFAGPFTEESSGDW
ncbi:uncharacterized protein LOC129886706 [Solanum dulcamara]|uniref:uncharacterized protein LOC129886706 n=1 Tax=Solanum dulcamara TaxID=45834 RepID=UPI00248514BB|nr:uncharacterized protein LOC129886706 [Solanum dulcamara]